MAKYSPAQKARVLAALAMGTPIAQVAREHGLPRGTVQGWVRESTPVASLIDSPKKREDLGELAYEYLETGFRAAIVQHRTFADPEWISKQSAPDLYRLYGTMVDKLAMVARGIERGRAQVDQIDAGGDGPP